jgi:uncharacterized membrane protein
MIRVMLFFHILGFVLWMGGAFAVMVASIAARREDRRVLGPLTRLQGAIARAVVGPGAGVTVVTGLVLTVKLFGSGAATPSGWLLIMQAAGLLAGILTLALTVPTAARLGRLDPIGDGALFDAMRDRQRVVGMISGLLGLVALFAGVAVRF